MHTYFYPVFGGGGGTTSFGPIIFPICSPLLPVINDQSPTVLDDVDVLLFDTKKSIIAQLSPADCDPLPVSPEVDGASIAASGP